MDLRQRLKAWRAHAGISRNALARRLEISAQAVAQWEYEGGTTPTQDNLEKFCGVVGISLARFWGPVPAATKRLKRKAA